jgi:hypothetical protein
VTVFSDVGSAVVRLSNQRNRCEAPDLSRDPECAYHVVAASAIARSTRRRDRVSELATMLKASNHFLLASRGTLGNLSPLLSAGRRLRDNRHHVRAMADPAMRAEVEAARSDAPRSDARSAGLQDPLAYIPADVPLVNIARDLDRLQELRLQLIAVKTMLAGHFNTIEVVDQAKPCSIGSWQSASAGPRPDGESLSGQPPWNAGDLPPAAPRDCGSKARRF